LQLKLEALGYKVTLDQADTEARPRHPGRDGRQPVRSHRSRTRSASARGSIATS